MKVCMLTTSFPRFRGDGAGIFIFHLSKALVERGVQVEVIAPHDYRSKITESWDKIRIHRFPYFFPLRYQSLCYGSGVLSNLKKDPVAAVQLPSLVLAQVTSALRRVRRSRPDVIHAHWTFPQGLTALLLKVITGIPYIVTVHGSDVFGLNHPAFKRLNALMLKQAAACTVNSKATLAEAVGISGRGDVQTIPMGVDLNLFKRIPNARTLWKIDKGEKVILFVGRLIEVKGGEYLLKALSEVLRDYPDVRLVITGSGPDKNRLVALAKHLGIDHKVTFMGYVPQGDLPKLYSAADLFVLPSIQTTSGETEGLGLVLLEAMACGTPVVGTASGGIPDIIEDEETGLLALEKNPHDLADKILRLLGDEPLRRRVAEKGFEFVKQAFSWGIVAGEFYRVYKEATLFEELHP